VRIFLTILLLTSVFAISSDAIDFPTVESFLQQTLAGKGELLLEAKGDLNNDGLEDWSGVVRHDKPNSQGTQQLYVLLRQPEGGYRVAEKSRAEEIAGMGCCWMEDLRIERSSIYIQNNAKTAATMEAVTHQFKFYKNEWRLIGARIYHIDHPTDVATETDMNLLTGAVIEKRWKGEHKPAIKRRKKPFGRFLLKDFDFFNGFGIE
jgi:hypothetical protein